MTNNSGPVTFNWNFGDGSAPDTNQFARHVYSGLAAAGVQTAVVSSGAYSWKVVATVGSVSATNTGSITITAPAALAMVPPAKQSSSSQLSLSWPSSVPNVVVEQASSLGAGAQWTVVTNLPIVGPSSASVSLPVGDGNHFYRLRQPW